MTSQNIDLVTIDDSSSIHVINVQEAKLDEFGRSLVMTSTAPIPLTSPPDDSDAESATSRQGHELR